MKKILAMLLALVMVLGLVACGGTAPETTVAPPAESNSPESTPVESDPAVSEVEYKIAMITDYGDITDQSFNQTTYEACKAFADENGIKFTYYKPVGNSTAERVAMVDAAVIDGYNVIVMPGFAFGETLAEVADLYPDVKFVALDVVGLGIGGNQTQNHHASQQQSDKLLHFVNLQNLFFGI